MTNHPNRSRELGARVREVIVPSEQPFRFEPPRTGIIRRNDHELFLKVQWDGETRWQPIRRDRVKLL